MKHWTRQFRQERGTNLPPGPQADPRQAWRGAHGEDRLQRGTKILLQKITLHWNIVIVFAFVLFLFGT